MFHLFYFLIISVEKNQRTKQQAERVGTPEVDIIFEMGAPTAGPQQERANPPMRKPDWIPKLLASEPLVYLILCVLAYGLLIGKLGFYWDDWPTIFYLQNGRIAQLINHFSYDRPFSVWVYYLIGQLGVQPLAWHLSALALRWGTVVAMAWALKGIFPGQRRFIFGAAVLFAVYPGYYVQPLSVIFSAHLASYIAFFVSLGAMARAIRHPERRTAWTLLALVTAIVQLFTLEYFAGLELVRPLIIWLLLPLNLSTRERLLKTAKLWSPYAFLFVTWVLWRIVLLELPREPYPLAISRDLWTSAVALVQLAGGDLLYALAGAWRDAMQLSATANWLAVAGGSACALLVGLWLRSHKPTSPIAVKHAWQALALGTVALFAGLGPTWIIGEAMSKGDYSRRYMLIAMFGATLVLSAALAFVFRSEKRRMLALSLLIGLSSLSQIANAADFKSDWEIQRSLYWQLHWRAPSLAPHTALITFDEITPWTGQPLLGVALSALYSPQLDPSETNVWNFELRYTRVIDTIIEGGLLGSNYRGLAFGMRASDNLLVIYKPADGCLWALGPEDASNPYLPDKRWSPSVFSNLQVIRAKGEPPDERIFGAEPERDWCYFFEKADLARQQGKWQAVLDNLEQANRAGLHPNIRIEFMPFIEAFAQTAQWGDAIALSRSMYQQDMATRDFICSHWSRFLSDLPSAKEAEGIQGLLEEVECERVGG